MSAVARALLDELGPDDLAQLAQRLAPYLTSPAPAPAEGGWLSTREAAEYAGCSVDALHKAMARRDVQFEQSSRGGKAWFRRSDVDAWRSR
jgi:excisionase family DNA binding protein